MKISQILNKVKSQYESHGAIQDLEILDVVIDSRLVKKGSIFFALDGKSQNGDKFIASAITNGASLIVAKGKKDLTSPIIICSDPFALLIEILQIFYAPLPQNIYAVTGTNGKTSVAEMTRQMLEFLGKKSASIGTLGVTCDQSIQEKFQKSALTTPDVACLYKNLHILKENAIDDVIIEVSSIGLEQGRVAGLDLSAGSFTNFTQDHLDYHGSMDQYFDCKMILFKNLMQDSSSAILNSDIDQYSKIKEICQAKNHKIYEYGRAAKDLKLQKIEELDFGQKVSFQLKGKDYQFTLNCSGEFQAYNALCSLGNILAKNNLNEESLENLLAQFHLLNPAPGRMQKVATLKNNAQIFIDFAHSPDALENILKSARKFTKNNLIILFGCGGDRDAAKRPLMGGVSILADKVIVTDDNPRSEDPHVIRSQIMAACDAQKTIEIAGRQKAIEEAIQSLKENDILILAGKGHEKYQIIGTEKTEFDEEQIIKDAIRKLP